jgi:hydrogenase maturation protease
MSARFAQEAPRVLVLGVGNLLWADEGFGVRCVEALGSRWRFDGDVSLVDGGTQGLALLGVIGEATHVVLFDALDFGHPPGTLLVYRDDEVPAAMGRDKMSLHQAGMNDVLACLALTGRSPRHITLIGVQPVQLEDYGGSLSDPVRAQVEPALALGLAELRSWGITAAPLDVGAADVVADPLALHRYESERPAEDAACRVGDARVLVRMPPRALDATES